MAGILDGKSRMMDTIITKEGRRQIAEGNLRVHYVTFTDRHTFYTQEDDDANDDADDRIFFEAINRPQDQIIFETDDEGDMLPFDGQDVQIRFGRLWRKSRIEGAITRWVTKSRNVTLSEVPKDEFTEATDELLQNSADNFKNQQIIGSKDQITGESGFEVSPMKMKFKIGEWRPMHRWSYYKANVEKVESLHQDWRLQHLPFFEYLPPVNKPKPGYAGGDRLGVYSRISQHPEVSLKSLLRRARYKQGIKVKYLNTSRENNLVFQMLEVKPGSVQKLAMIDYGEFPDSSDPSSASTRVCFVGKIFEDDEGSKTFVNMFMLVFR